MRITRRGRDLSIRINVWEKLDPELDSNLGGEEEDDTEKGYRPGILFSFSFFFGVCYIAPFKPIPSILRAKQDMSKRSWSAVACIKSYRLGYIYIYTFKG